MKNYHQEMLASLACELPDEVLKYKMCGDFAGAQAAIDRWLERPLAQELKNRLLLEKEILGQLGANYPYTESQVLALFRGQVADFAKEDLARLDRDGLAEWIMLDGEKHYIHNIVRNVLDKDAEIRRRAGREGEISEEKKNLFAAIREMREKGGMTKRFRLRTSIRLKDELFYPGIHLKAHLPLPACLHQISGVRLLAHCAGKVTVDAEDSLYRAVCIEDTLNENREFFIEYEYTVRAPYHDFSDEDAVRAYRACEAGSGAQMGEVPVKTVEGSVFSVSVQEAMRLYTAEQLPHIRFSPYLRALAAEIAGDEKEPLALARRIYDYITKNVNYSYMRDYFLIPDIPQYCARNLRGDCGVQALLFITLCRICGVPAKWQSGLYAVPGYVGPHDWAMFYAEPYGWLFADLSFGGSAFRDGDEAQRQFYFGNLDPFRMAANNAFQQPFASAKRFLPIDPYDNQIGELESDERGYRRSEVETAQVML